MPREAQQPQAESRTISLSYLHKMQLQNLYLLLKDRAEACPDNGITFYTPGKLTTAGTELKYPDLLKLAQENAWILHQFDIEPNSIILLHFNNHLDNVTWFWSVICAGFIPALSTPFTSNPAQRQKHILHLYTVLDNPLCLTRDALLPEFASQDVLKIQTIDHLPVVPSDFNGFSIKNHIFYPLSQGSFKRPDSLAALMLTSGSTGNAKAVCLTHGQILASIESKSRAHFTNRKHTFLNWIGFDHVACLTENHLHALWTGARQVMAEAEDIVQNPVGFLSLVNKHRVAVAFAPNFFLAALKRALEKTEENGRLLRSVLDVQCLRTIVSGGEANVVETAVALTRLLQEYGGPENVVSPAFGMTETCGGSVYSKECPRLDVERNNEFAAVGYAVDAMEMRITDAEGRDIGQNVVGNLEVRGPVVFRTYFNNPEATKASFNGDWFMTGDCGVIDDQGRLLLTGRSKETVIINGVNYFPHEIEAVLENIPGAKHSYTLVFPYRPTGSPTEKLCVVYLPTYEPEDIEKLIETNDTILKRVLQQTGVRPYVLPLDVKILAKSTLGKLPRAKIRLAFEKGEYFEAFQKPHDEALAKYREANYQGPTNATEELILTAFQDIFDVPEHELGIKTNIFALGIDSIGLIRLKQRLGSDMYLDVPIITIMTHSTIQDLAIALENLQKPRSYNPMVVLQSQGSKAPLWLIHPGVGEILIFLKLSSYLTDRPVYAMRARGFEPGEPYFPDISTAVTTYYQKIKEQQPSGPYAIAGYSYGSMIAFEIVKLLLKNNDEVRFLGVLNLPPHIKFRMRQLDWTNCLLHLSYFLGFFSEEYAHAQHPVLQKLSHSEVLDHVLSVAPRERMEELGLDRVKLANWADLAYSLQSSAVDYEPQGIVKSIDVFCAIPLAAVAKNMEDWKTNHLGKWRDFSEEEPRLHEVDGAHYTMIGPEHVYSFQKRLKGALEARGI
ncbi:hypothetical protein ACMFMG_010741 [Clarireedia jacksonii]